MEGKRKRRTDGDHDVDGIVQASKSMRHNDTSPASAAAASRNFAIQQRLGGAPPGAASLGTKPATQRIELTLPQDTGPCKGTSWHEDGDSDDLDLDQLPSDTQMVIQHVRERFLAHVPSATLPPLVLVSQLHATLTDPSVVEKELDSLRRANTVRMFKIMTGADEHGVMVMDDYINCLNRTTPTANATNEGDPTSPSAAATPQAIAIETFIKHVVPAQRELSISHAQLIRLMRNGYSRSKSKASRPSAASSKMTAGELAEEQVSILLNLGVIARHPADPTSYLFCVPNMGSVIKSILTGRTELLNLIKRRRYKEVPEKQLLTATKLRSSKLSMDYHLKDLLGKRVLLRLQVPAGPVIKLPV